jgi:hypothetical protein
MIRRNAARAVGYAVVAILGTPVWAASHVEGTFLVQGVDAKLAHARAARVELEPGKPGYAVLLSERVAEGDILSWRTADPTERGSFICLLLEANGAIYIAELGHASAKTGRFGVMTELQVSDFEVAGDVIAARLRTQREQTFGDDRYSEDLSFEAALEK